MKLQLHQFMELLELFLILHKMAGMKFAMMQVVEKLEEFCWRLLEMMEDKGGNFQHIPGMIFALQSTNHAL